MNVIPPLVTFYEVPSMILFIDASIAVKIEELLSASLPLSPGILSAGPRHPGQLGTRPFI